MMKCLFNISIVTPECTDEVFVIRDNDGQRSVTNSAEEVVEFLNNQGLLGSKRLLYYDTEGYKDELVHDGHGKFLGFNILS